MSILFNILYSNEKRYQPRHGDSLLPCARDSAMFPGGIKEIKTGEEDPKATSL